MRAKLRVTTVLHSFQFTTAKKSLLYPLHTHPAFEIIIPRKKIYRCILNGERISVPPAKILFVQIGDTHQDIYERGMQYIALTFTLDVFGSPGDTCRVFKRGVRPAGQTVNIPRNKSFAAIKRLIERETFGDSVFAHHAANGLFTVFFWEMIRCVDGSLLSPLLSESASQELFRRELLRCFDERLTKKVTLGEIAEAMRMSKSSLSHKSMEILGISPLRALSNHRMQKARQMLLETNASVKETGESLGFENQFHFSRVFKKRFGQSPIKLR